MAESIKKLQADLISDGTLDKMAAQKSDFSSYRHLPLMEQFMIRCGAEMVKKVIENLNRKGMVYRGGLSTDITQGEIEYLDKGLQLKVGYPGNTAAAEYYAYQDEGVRGWKSGRPNSRFKFKQTNPSRNMVDAFVSYMTETHKMARNESQKFGLSKLQTKRKRLKTMVDESKRLRQSAFAYAKAVKMGGIEKTGFFTSAINYAFGPDFERAIGDLLQADIKLAVRKYMNDDKFE